MSEGQKEGPKNEKFIGRNKLLATIGLIAVAAIYLTATIIFVTDHLIMTPSDWMIELIAKNYAGIIVLPTYAFAVLLFVILLDIRATQPLKFEALGFKFEGASAPFVLWLAGMLMAILGLKLLWIP